MKEQKEMRLEIEELEERIAPAVTFVGTIGNDIVIVSFVDGKLVIDTPPPGASVNMPDNAAGGIITAAMVSNG